MDKIRIYGGQPLHGKIQVSGAKNSALPILLSSLLTEDICMFSRVPHLQDVRTTLKVLEGLGVKVEQDPSQNKVRLQADQIQSREAPYDLVRTMRASVLVLGPLLARFGEAKVSLPGGCAIGARPVGYHLNALKKMGADIHLEGGYIVAKADHLRGARIAFEFPSVGATEHLMMAACLAEGETILENCAREPEISDLATALRSMGADIQGDGQETIVIQGKQRLHGAEHHIIGDRIEGGTFLAAAFATGGSIRVEGIDPLLLESVLIKFEESGAKVIRDENAIELHSQGRPKGTDITTLPFPGFPTDMQAQFMAVMAVASGTSVITETIFENRFMHVSELARLGAKIKISGKSAIVEGCEELVGAPLMATDLRASASLIVGALCAKGETIINRIYHLDRGYEQMEQKLGHLGAKVERIR